MSKFPQKPIDVRSECVVVARGSSVSGTHRTGKSLFVIHSSVLDVVMMRMHARVLALSASSSLIKGGDLVYAYNGKSDAVTRRSLRAEISKYPQVISGGLAWLCDELDNAGYWCGQFCDWSRVSTAWSVRRSGNASYSAVVYVEDDVFLTPLAVRTLERAINMPATKAGSGVEGSAASWFVSRYRDGLGSSRYRQSFNMDMVAHRSHSMNPRTWEHACRQCVDGAAMNPARPSPTKGASPPGGAEHLLWRTINASGLRVHVLLPTTFHGTRKMDAMGVWHAHNATDVEVWLRSEGG